MWKHVVMETTFWGHTLLKAEERKYTNGNVSILIYTFHLWYWMVTNNCENNHLGWKTFLYTFLRNQWYKWCKISFAKLDNQQGSTNYIKIMVVRHTIANYSMSKTHYFAIFYLQIPKFPSYSLNIGWAPAPPVSPIFTPLIPEQLFHTLEWPKQCKKGE